MAVAPAVVLTNEVDPDGTLIPKPEWARVTSQAVDAEVSRLSDLQGAVAFSFDEVKACGEPCMKVVPAFLEWGRAASLDIYAQIKGRKDFNVKSVAAWRFGGNLEPLSRALVANYVLFVVVRDSHESKARQHSPHGAFAVGLVPALIVGTGPPVTPSEVLVDRQVGVACLARLHDGKMVWCNTVIDRESDVCFAPGATSLARHLLSDLWRPEPPTYRR